MPPNRDICRPFTVLAINSCRKRNEPCVQQQRRSRNSNPCSTADLLVLIVAGTTASSLLIVRNRLQQHVQETLAADLQHSNETFQDLEANRRLSLEKESSLLASLPSLKALMTTSDPRTITDDAVDFWKTSGNDLFALADAEGRILAANARGLTNTDELKRDLQTATSSPGEALLAKWRSAV